jgi:hypothetical protein
MKLFQRLMLAGFFIACFSFPSASQYTNILIDDEGSPNEPSIWINPANPMNIIAGANLNNAYTSFDGGLTWQKQTLTSSYSVWGDPCIMSDSLGHIYFYHLSNPPFGNWIDRIVCQKSTDGGLTWNDGSFTGLNGTKAQDKEWAVIDPATQTIYMTWTQFDSYGSSSGGDSSVILFSKSTDMGMSWSTPVRINQLAGDCIDSDNTSEGAVPAVGPNGEVYVCWSNRDTLFFDRSTDGGVTWLDEDIFLSTQPGGWDYSIEGIYRSNGLPVTKCDLSGGPNHGTIYVNWSDQRNGANNTDVFLAKSTNGGLTWTAPVKVNDDNTERQQFFTWMDVDQKTGVLYFIFYDRRNYDDKKTDVYLAYSTDGGTTFVNQLLSETSFSPKSFVFFGDYTNISAFNGKVAPIWARMDGDNTSVWTAQVDFATLSETDMQTKAGDFSIEQNFPNPFTAATQIKINVNTPGFYTLTLYDLMGRRLFDFFTDQWLTGKEVVVELNADHAGLTQNTYLYALNKGNEVVMKKFIVVAE